MNFKFPVYHKCCDECKYRFVCFTTKVNFTTTDGQINYHFAHPVHLACFELEPFTKVNHILLTPSEEGTILRCTIKNPL